MSGDVTFKPKCYVFVCLGCGLLADSKRSDAITCSGACRVRVHRNGRDKRWLEQCERLDITPAMCGHVEAIQLLAPDMAAELRSGKRRKIDSEVRQVVWAAYWARLMQVLDWTP